MANNKSRKNLRHRAAERRSSFFSNPPPGTDILYEIGPAFGAYAAGRFTGRVAMKMGAAKLGKHAAPLATTTLAALAWFLVHRFKKLERFHTPIIVGTSIAALQTIAQAYLPKYSWLLSDATPEQYLPAAPTPTGMGAWPGRRRRRFKPVGDQYDAMEEQAQAAAEPATEEDFMEPNQAAGAGAGSSNPQPIDVDPSEWEPGNEGDDDFGSLAGGMSN